MQLDDLWFGRFLFVLRHFFFYFLCALLFFPFFSSSSFFRYSFCLLSLADSLLFDCLCVCIAQYFACLGFSVFVQFFLLVLSQLDCCCFFFGVHNVDSMSCVLFLSFSHCILVLKFRTCVNVKYRDLRWETTQLLHIRSMYCICECRFLKIIRNSHLTGHSINFTLAFNALHDAIYISTLQFVQQDRTQH